MAHELANLLDGCLRNVGLAITALRDGSVPTTRADDDEALRRLESASSAMQHMARLIRLWLSRPGGRPGQESPAMSVAEAVEQVVALLRPVAMARGVRLRFDVSAKVAHLPGGPLFPIVLNAIRNSLEAMPPQPDRDGRTQTVGHVVVTVAGGDDHLELRVEDDGPGLSPTLMDGSGRLRLGQTSKTAGNGLGLALCRDIAADMGGSLEVVNRHPRGAALIFRCPLAALNAVGPLAS